MHTMLSYSFVLFCLTAPCGVVSSYTVMSIDVWSFLLAELSRVVFGYIVCCSIG